MDTISIPALDDDRVLRHVEIDGRFRLLLWDTYRREGKPAKDTLGYAFSRIGESEPIFVGEDYGCAPGHAIDSDDAVRSLLGFLTLRPGDTDDEYFERYTEAQRAFAASDAEYLSLWGMDDLEEGPMPLVDVE